MKTLQSAKIYWYLPLRGVISALGKGFTTFQRSLKKFEAHFIDRFKASKVVKQFLTGENNSK